MYGYYVLVTRNTINLNLFVPNKIIVVILRALYLLLHSMSHNEELCRIITHQHLGINNIYIYMSIIYINDSLQR